MIYLCIRRRWYIEWVKWVNANDYDVCSVNNKHSSVCLLLIVYTGTLYRVHKGSQIVYTQCVIKAMFKMFFNMKETVRVISSNPPMKMTMPDSQRYPWNLYLINYLEVIFVFQGLKVFNSCMLSCSRNARVCWELTVANNQFWRLQICIFNSCLIRQTFQGYRCLSDIAIFA